MRILIADDDDVVVTVIETLLSDWGHTPVVARDGVEAWELMQRDDSPTLVILDWLMPGLAGIDICERLRRSGKRPYQYVIMLTAKDKHEDLVQGMDAGADDYLRKPFDERELRARIHAAERILTLQDALRAKATFDELTGVLNRATILRRLQRQLEQATGKAEPTSVLLVDLDNFKQINDTHGHPVGDEVLREAAIRLQGSMRTYDELGRFGGEEFLAVLSNCDQTEGTAVAERMRSSINASPVSTSAGLIKLTGSFGIASAVSGFNPDTLIAQADIALYLAKRGGRDRVMGSQANVTGGT